MEKRNLKVSFYKAGNGISTRVNVPIVWLRKLGISEENKEIELLFDEEKKCLILKKRN